LWGAILAAGLGTRLYPITALTPKPLLRFLGKPFCEHQLTEQNKVGVTSQTILINPKFRELYLRALGKKIHIVEQPKPLGTADAIRRILENTGERTLIQYGDNLILHPSIKKLIEAHKHSYIATIGAVEVSNPSSYGVVELGHSYILKRIVEKPQRPRTNLVFAGVLLVEPDFLKFLKGVKPSIRGELEVTDALNEAAKNEKILVVKFDKSTWLDLTYPWDVLIVNKFFQDNFYEQKIEGDIEKNVTIKGKVHVGKGSLIKSGSYIEGPVWIGNNVTIGPNSYLRAYSYIDNECRIGNGCEIKASVIYSRTKISHLSYIGDSVISEDVNIGAGTIAANLRFDEKSVKVELSGKMFDSGFSKLGCFIGPRAKIGINVSINPGIVIGRDVKVYPGCVVSKNIQDEEVYKCF